MLYAVLSVAFIVRLLLLVPTLSAWPATWRVRKTTGGIGQFVVCLVLAIVACQWVFRIELRNALAVAFVAELLVHLRELLDAVLDLCVMFLLRTPRRR